LDNRDELSGALGLSAAAIAQMSDADLLLHSLERWGEAALDRLVGDFAFALWNATEQKLLLARDFLGQRPLHYYRNGSFFAFASMPKGLHALPDIPCAPDEQMVVEFLALMPQRGPRSFFKDIARVEPAHIVTVTRDGVSSRRYWQPRRPDARLQPENYVEGLRHHLDQATLARLRGANGAVGANLSAGLDSGAVTATAARLLAPSGGKVIAFTAVPRKGYDGPDLRNRFGDEGPLAAATAALYPNVEHVCIRSDHISPLDGIDREFFLFNQPMLSLSNMVWINAINRAARERKLGIMLLGATGNATASYTGIELLPELMREGRLFKLWQEAAQLVAKAGMRWRGVLAHTIGAYLPVGLWLLANRTFLGHAPEISAYSAIRAETLIDLHIDDIARERDLDFTYRPWKDGFAMRLWMLQRADSGSIHKGILAGWGIDRRDPMADKRLVEFCLSVPTEQYLANGVQRALAKRALADRLPQAVLDEQKKGYQAVDWHEGLTAARPEVAAELQRIAAFAPASNILDVERMKALVENWPSSGWERTEVAQSYRLSLMRGIAAGHFLRKAAGSNQ
jgi:asparagine synthase (glutamine-hydrolysing)